MNLRNYLARCGNNVERLRQRNRVQIRSRSDLITKTSNRPGLYWIETNMPAEDITPAIKACSGKMKRIRKTKPDGIGFTKQINGYQIVYSGTDNNLQKRLLEHLFDEGNDGTTKMSLKIDCQDFTRFDWFVSCVYKRLPISLRIRSLVAVKYWLAPVLYTLR